MNTYIFKTLPLVAVLLLFAACNQQDLVIDDEPQAVQERIIPYTVSVGSDVLTRASLNNTNQYVFESGDKLYVWGTGIYGELTLTSGEGDYQASFTGNLHWSGSGEGPDASSDLYAVIVGPNNSIFGTLEEFKNRGYVPDYSLATSFASSKAEAVQFFSYFTSWNTYSAHEFSFRQGTAYLSFDITLEDGTAAGQTVEVSISNGSQVVRSASVKTIAEGGNVKARFITGFPEYTKLDNASVKLGDRDPISFGGTNTLYTDCFNNVTKTYTRYKITATGTFNIFQQNVPFSVVKDNIKDETTLGEILGNKFTSITAFSSTGSSIIFGSFDPDNWDKTTVTVKEEGNTVITVTGKATAMNHEIDVEDQTVTLTVAKMTPPAN